MRSAHAHAPRISPSARYFSSSAAARCGNEISQAAQALSLFARNRIVEIRMPGGKPGSSGAAALLRLFRAAGPDLLVLIVTGQLERETQGAEWVQAAQERGAWLPIWPVDRARLPHWLRARFAAAGLKATRGCDRAAGRAQRGQSAGRAAGGRQACAAAAAGASVSVAEVAAGSADSARFDVFQLVGSGARSAMPHEHCAYSAGCGPKGPNRCWCCGR